jgi:hypothetical protein
MAKRKNEKAPDAGTSEAQKATRKSAHGNANKNKTQSVTALRLALLANSYQPIPVVGKAAYLTGWSSIIPTEAIIRDWEQSRPNEQGTGILTRKTPAIDIDIKDEAIADELEAHLRKFFNGKGRLMRRVGEPPKRAFLFRTETPFDKLQEKFVAPEPGKFLDKNGKEYEHKLEILCDGQQLVVDGIHPDTGKPYTWADGVPWEVPREDLPPLTQGQAQAWLDEAKALLVARGWQRVGKSQTTDTDIPDGDFPLIVKLGLRLRGSNSKWTNDGGGQFRIGTHGSLHIDANTRTWFDFEAGVGGGIRDLMKLASGKAATEEEIKLVVEPHSFPDEATLPLWDWLYGKHLLRGTVSITAAFGGTGKSSLSVVEALAMTSGNGLLCHHHVSRPLRVLLINLEDNRNAMDKRIAAAMKHYKLKPVDIGGRLFTLAKNEFKFLIAEYGAKNGSVQRNEAAINSLIEFVAANKIDVVSIDPLINTHGVNESSQDMQKVIACYDDIADKASCAIHLWHHMRKPGGEEVTIESIRGATAIVDACRSSRILVNMTKAEADKLSHNQKDPRFYFQEFSGRRTFAPPAHEATWYELASITLDNSPLFGDDIGVVTPWLHPGAKEIELTPYVIAKIKEVVAANEWRDDIRATMWVGKAVAQVVGLDPVDDAPALKRAVQALLRSGALKRVPGKRGNRTPTMLVVPGDDAQVQQPGQASEG